jgi:hypothetical protein
MYSTEPQLRAHSATTPSKTKREASGEEPGREQPAPAVSPLTARPTVIVGWNNEMRATYLGSCLSFGWAYRGGPLCHMYGSGETGPSRN